MNRSNNNLKTTVNCVSLSNNNNIVSRVTKDIPPKNDNNGSSEGFADFINSKNRNSDVDVPSANDNLTKTGDCNDINLQIKMPARTKNIPPKDNEPTENSTRMLRYSKNQKENVPKTVFFDELLVDLNYNTLYANFTKLLQFLKNSNSIEMCFPFISKRYEELFKIIVRDVNVLKSTSLDANYRDICDQIIVVVNSNKSVYLLAYAIECRKDFRDVLVLKKEYKNIKKKPVQTKPKTSSSCLESKMQSTESSRLAEPDELLQRSTSNTSHGFKLHCLRATLTFVKNNIKQKLEFSELNTKQAEYMCLLLKSAVAFADFDIDFEIEGLYRALCEAIKIYSLKYEFRIKIIDTTGERKSLVFEKVLKHKLADPAINPNEMPKQNYEVQKRPEISKKTEKQEIKNLENINFVKSLPRTFVLNALNTIIEFLSNDNSWTLLLLPKNEDELRFYRNAIEWSRFSPDRPTFDGGYEKLFWKIGMFLTYKKCKVPKGRKCKRNTETGIKEVTYKKKKPILAPPPVDVPSTPQREVTYKKKKPILAPPPVDVPSTPPRGSKKLNIKLQKLVNTDKSTDSSNTEIGSRSLRNKKKNKKQRHESMHASKDRLISTGLSNKKTDVKQPRYDWADSHDSGSEQTDSHQVTSLDKKKVGPETENPSKKTTEKSIQKIQASLAEQEKELEVLKDNRESKPQLVKKKATFTRRENELLRKEHLIQSKTQLIEGLSTPVQSDKAMKMMRGMGWSGGALGARGTGITEPIMPAIDIVAGAGLGHVDSLSKLPKKSAYSRIGRKWLSEGSSENQTHKPDSDFVVEKTKQLLRENLSFDTLTKDYIKKSTSDSYKAGPFGEVVLKNVLQLLTTDATSKVLKYNAPLLKKDQRFLLKGFHKLADRFKMSDAEQVLLTEILKKYNELPGLAVIATISDDHREVELQKHQPFSDEQIERFTTAKHKQKTASNVRHETPVEDDADLSTFIDAIVPTCGSKKVIKGVKFRALILVKILIFIKSDDEELDVIFNDVLRVKKTEYIESTIESVNIRIRFGCSPTELELTDKIIKHIGDAFLGVIFNHEYTSFTLQKYFHLNKKGCPIKQPHPSTTFNFDDPSDTSTDNIDKDVHGTEMVNDSAKIRKREMNKNESMAAIKSEGKSIKEINKKNETMKEINKEDDLMKEFNNKEDVTLNKINHEYESLKEVNKDCGSLTEFNKEYESIKKIDKKHKSLKEINKKYKSMKVIKQDTSIKRTVSENSPETEVCLYILCHSTTIVPCDDDVMKVGKPIAPYDEDCMKLEKNLVPNDEDSMKLEKSLIPYDHNTIEVAKTLVQCNDDLKLGITLVPRDDDVIEAAEANFEDETDFDSIINQNIELSENNCDNEQLLEVSEIDKLLNEKDLVKEFRVDPRNPETDNNLLKKIYSGIKNVYLVPVNYPNEVLLKQQAKEIQILIAGNIRKTEELPLLVCHGVQNGALIYTCHNENTFHWLNNVISVTSDVKVLDIKNVKKMSLKLYCLFDFDIKYLFHMIELYNDLSTKEWIVEETKIDNDFTIFLVRMDQFSINFIHASDLALFAGVDKVEFSLIWD